MRFFTQFLYFTSCVGTSTYRWPRRDMKKGVGTPCVGCPQPCISNLPNTQPGLICLMRKMYQPESLSTVSDRWSSVYSAWVITQRVLNDLLRTKLSYGRIIRFLSHPLSRQQVLSLSQSSCESPVELTHGRKGGGWARNQIRRPRESMALFKSFNTLCE